MKTITQGVIAVITMLAIESAFGRNLLQFTSARATADGAIQMNWSSVSNAIYEIDYANALSDSGTQWNPLYINYTSQGTNTLFMDAGVYYQQTVVEHPRNFPQRFYRVIQTGANDVDPPVVAVTSPTNGYIASGLLNISMTATGSLPVAQVHIFVDGEEVRVSAAGDTNFTINTCEWPNGTHIIYAVADGISGALSSPPPTNSLYTSGASPFVQVQFNNFISQYTFSQSFFQPALGQTQNISAQFAAYADWSLVITDPQSNVVRSATGTGYNMSYAWDGTDQSGNPTLTGTFGFYLTASNSLSSPPLPPLPPSGGGGGGPPSPPSPNAAFSAGGGLDSSETIQVPMPPLPPGLATNDGPQYFTIKRPSFSASASGPGNGAIVLASPSGVQLDDGPLNPPAPAQPEATPQPSRPDTRPRKDLSGTIGLLALQNYGSANNRPDNGIAGSVVIDLSLPLPSLAQWPKFICNSFEITMKAGGFLTNFYYVDGQVTADQLEGGNNIFNSGVDFGLIACHGAKAINNSLDFHFPTPTLEAYIPLPVTVGKYPWIPLSSMKFGGDRLKWMGIYACNLLYEDNYLNMLDHNELPISAKLHMFISGSTTIYGNGAFGAALGRDLTGVAGANSIPMTVHDAWLDAAKQAHDIENRTNPIKSVCKVRFLFWDPCFSDTIYSYAASTGGGTDQVESDQDEQNVFTPQ